MSIKYRKELKNIPYLYIYLRKDLPVYKGRKEQEAWLNVESNTSQSSKDKAYTGIPKKNETVKTTQNSINMTI